MLLETGANDGAVRRVLSYHYLIKRKKWSWGFDAVSSPYLLTTTTVCIR